MRKTLLLLALFSPVLSLGARGIAPQGPQETAAERHDIVEGRRETIAGRTDAHTADAGDGVNSNIVLPYKAGEKLEYSVSFIASVVPNIDMAKLTINVSDDKVNGIPAYHIHAFVRTTVARWAFKMDNSYLTWIDKQTHLPLKAACTVKEGDYEYSNQYVYDWDNMEVTITATRPGKYENKESALPLEEGSRDIAALIYSLRSAELNFSESGEGYISLLNQESERRLKCRIAGRESLKVKGLGTINTIRVACEVTTRDGESFEEGNELNMWFTDDANRVPVFIESPIKWGRIRARLSSWENLKFPEESVLR